MFFTEGWLSVHEVYAALRKFRRNHPDFDDYSPDEHPFLGPGWDTFLEDFFGLCLSCDSAGILLPNGSLVLADRFFLFSFSMEDKAHRFFSLPDGVIGQGSYSEKFAVKEIENEIIKLPFLKRVLRYFYDAGQKSGVRSWAKEHREKTFVGFAGARVLFRESDFQEYLKAMAGDRPESVSEKRCAALLVAAIDRGEGVNKATAKQDFAPNLGQRAFLRAWQMAAAERPEISKPGRPRQRK